MRYHALDGLRGIAALAVVTAHADQFFGGYTFGRAGLAVDLFFILSGFVLAGAYGPRLDRGTGWFMRVRLVRLYPLYLAGTLLGLLYAYLDRQPVTAMSVFAALLMLPSPGGLTSALYPFDSPAWSLLFELVTNALWSAVRRRWVIWSGIACSLALMVAAVVLSRTHTLAIGFQWDHVPFGLGRAIFSFAVGVGLRRISHVRPLVGSWPVIGILALAGAILAAPMTGWAGGVYDLVVVTLVFPPMVYVASRLEPGPRVARLCGWVGGISYGVYAIHDPLSNLVGMALDPAAHAPWSGVAFLSCLALVCWVLDRAYDAPVRAWLSDSLFAPRTGRSRHGEPSS